MIQSFGNEGTEGVFDGRSTRKARKACPQQLWHVASRKLDLLDSVEKLHDMMIVPGNKLESLTGDRRGQYSIRINEQYRICFSWSNGGPRGVEITDYHK